MTNASRPAAIDQRESLCNDRRRGTAAEVSLPLERITRLHGFVLDLDPKLLAPSNPLFPPADDPAAFFNNIGPTLERHPLLRHAEVRSSGTGLHAVVRIDPPVELTSEADQTRWRAVVGAVRCTLPTDPDAPGITALTRPVGSVNSKNGAGVELLKGGTPVSPDAVERYVRELAAAPFKTVAAPLLGGERLSPCPVCRGPGSRLDVLDRCGRCYGGCGTVNQDRLYDVAYRTIEGGGRVGGRREE